ncbi:hypothetical protein HDU67_004024 [Dinochytrium kinnereticum]|nr:hypothetical protein HDU67_004024 [Dinochytrium kinnereticum]
MFAPATRSNVLFTYKDPLSPHLTAILENRPISDEELVQAVRRSLDETHRVVVEEDLDAVMFVETAGGVHSPAPSGNLQSQVYRPLRLPTILVGDSNLGGISTTLTSHDSLLLNGYDIPLILLFSDTTYDNALMIQRHARSFATSTPPLVLTIPRPPSRPQNGDARLDATNLMVYYADPAVQDKMEEAVRFLKVWHSRRMEGLQGLSGRARQVVWWPFTQHGAVKKTTVIDSAFGDRFSCFEEPLEPVSPKTTSPTSLDPKSPTSQNLFDGCASWWTQTVGHANPRLTLAMASTSGRYGHVMFPECAHEPAVQLSEELVESVGKGWGERVFFSDDGSTAVEVALKMAFRVAEVRTGRGGGERGWEVVGVVGGYHGDTIGAMNACSPNDFNEKVQWYKPQGLWFDAPTVVCKKGRHHIRLPPALSTKAKDLNLDLTYPDLPSILSPTLRNPATDQTTSSLSTLYRNHITNQLNDSITNEGRAFGALLIEPLLMGAGGMQMVDPLFQRELIDACRALSIPVIYDEVFTGLHRLGPHASVGCEVLGRTPDVACFAKSLTGGMVPMAVTVASGEVFEAFRGEKKSEALLHGHSYTAHPVGCAVALESLRMYKGLELGREVWDREIVDRISHLDCVDGVISMGTVLAVELCTDKKGYASASKSVRVCEILREKHGVFARPLGNVVYLMGSLTTSAAASRGVLEGLVAALLQL